ncbi:hypothetical protein [Kitasatospora sp. NPDC094015]|uniref:hypothetical protein n=1 Tax=Kitasatospora sp. NPDC094015 TaxID=3155205 RepID=UPI003334470D
MDALRVSALRASLAGSGWLECTREFGAELHRAVTRRSARGLLLVGTPAYEPWHLAAHLTEEAERSGTAGLAPVLLRRGGAAPGAPAHLSHGLERLAQGARGATVLVVTQGAADEVLLERVRDARRGGAAVLAVDGGTAWGSSPAGGASAWDSTAHRSLAVPDAGPEPFELVQHLVSAAAGERPRRGRLERLAGLLAAGPAPRW